MFNNVNLKVDNHKSHYIPSSNHIGGSAMPVFESMMKQSNEKEFKDDIDEKMKNDKKSKDRSNVAANIAFTESAIPRICNNILQSGKEAIFMDIMTDIYMESLYLDEDFKLEQSDSLKVFVQDYINANGGYNILTEACKKKKTPLLEKVKGVCEKCASKTSLRKGKELREACVGKKAGSRAMEVSETKPCFDMNAEEKKTYRKEREALSEDQIVDFVKGKVLNVVKGEKERQEDIAKFDEDINMKASDIVNEKCKKAVKESAMNDLMRNCQIDVTLFEAIQVSTLKESFYNADMGREDDDDVAGGDLEDFEGGRGSDEDLILKDDEILTESSQIDMDMILAESICKYTLLEMFHTLQLEDFTRSDVEKTCIKLMKK